MNQLVNFAGNYQHFNFGENAAKEVIFAALDISSEPARPAAAAGALKIWTEKIGIVGRDRTLWPFGAERIDRCSDGICRLGRRRRRTIGWAADAARAGHLAKLRFRRRD